MFNIENREKISDYIFAKKKLILNCHGISNLQILRHDFVNIIYRNVFGRPSFERIEPEFSRCEKCCARFIYLD